MRRAGEPLVSDTTTVDVTAGRPGPTPPPPHWPGDRSLADGWVRGEEEEEGARTQLQLGSSTPADQK